MIKTRLLWFKRVVHYSLNALFFELPRGIDFSMRDKHSNKEYGLNGYAMTSREALRNMLSKVDIRSKKFIDIGSGKGAVVYYAHQMGAQYSLGIEYSSKLHKIALNNFRILKCEDSCLSLNLDARKFSDYSEFDVYFLFNPFNDIVYNEVMISIKKQIRSDMRIRWIIAYGQSNKDAIMSLDNCHLVEQGICPYRNNNFAIYRIN
jgi:16S rRNA G966 N2-methylase RsmD